MLYLVYLKIYHSIIILYAGAHILIKFGGGGGELDCGTDFPIGVRATFLLGGGGREPIAQL